MGDSEVFVLFPQAHTYCISVTVAQQQRDNMSQRTLTRHGERTIGFRMALWEQLTLSVRRSEFPSLLGGVHASRPLICVRHTLEY